MFIVNKRHNSSLFHIERWSLNGQFMQTVVSSKLSSPASMVVDSIIDRLYWSDNYYGYIHTAKLDGTDRQTITSGLQSLRSTSSFRSLRSIALYENKIYFSSRNWIGTVNRFVVNNAPINITYNTNYIYDLVVNTSSMFPYSSDPCQNSSCAYMCLAGPNETHSCVCPPQETLLEDKISCAG